MTKNKTKDLKDVTGQTDVITIKELADQFSMTGLRVSQILKEAEVVPMGKIPQRDVVSGRPSPGKPSVAFNRAEAIDTVQKATSVKVGMAAAS